MNIYVVNISFTLSSNICSLDFGLHFLHLCSVKLCFIFLKNNLNHTLIVNPPEGKTKKYGRQLRPKIYRIFQVSIFKFFLKQFLF